MGILDSAVLMTIFPATFSNLKTTAMQTIIFRAPIKRRAHAIPVISFTFKCGVILESHYNVQELATNLSPHTRQ